METISNSAIESEKSVLVRSVIWLSWFTIIYNLIEGTLSIFFGIEEVSVSLFGFGVDRFMFNNRAVIAFLAVIWCLPTYAPAHEKHHHAPHGSENKIAEAQLPEKDIFEKINLNYNKEVKFIFQSKCMNCHSSQTTYPFYYKWPFAQKIIDDDITESKKHIDMTNGFPFAGHGKPLEDLDAIKKTVEENAMPPFRYRIMHWTSALTDTEKETVIQWIDESIKFLNKL